MMMKKIVIFLSVVLVLSAVPEMFSEANAQSKQETQVRKKSVRERKAERRVVRRVSRRAHLRYAGLPRYRAVVKVVPANAVIIQHGKLSYHYHEGIFYSPLKDGFSVIRPVHGARTRMLPATRWKVVVGGKPYFYYYGSFYTYHDNTSEYEVVEAPIGAVVDALPEGYEVQELNGTEYYVLDNVFFQEVETDEVDGGIGYEVVKI